MSMQGAVTTRGRPLMFTPERMEQIRNLVERGQTREQIAEIIGCTVGTLAVMCSRLGISLRRPKLDNGVANDRPPPPRLRAVEPDNNNDEPPSDSPKSKGQPPPAEQPEQRTEMDQPPPSEPSTDLITITISMEFRGRERHTDVQLPAQTIATLILEAEVRGLRLTELLAQIIVSSIENDFFKHLNNKDNNHHD